MLTQSDFWSAIHELRSLAAYCLQTGEDLESLITVPPATVARLRKAADASGTEERAMVERALAYRQVMLDDARRRGWVMSDLSILCITKVEPFTLPFLHEMARVATLCHAEFVLVFDGPPQCGCDKPLNFAAPVVSTIQLKSKGYLESIHDQALKQCSRKYVLRLDDDERCSPAMVDWLQREAYREAGLWKFPRAHLWGNATTKILTPPLWPDHQTRLGEKKFMDGRTIIHCGSPYGGGEPAPVAIEHHKFLVRPLEQRRAIVERYDRIAKGAGTAFAAFSVPEDVLPSLDLAPALDGWTPEMAA